MTVTRDQIVAWLEKTAAVLLENKDVPDRAGLRHR